MLGISRAPADASLQIDPEVLNHQIYYYLKYSQAGLLGQRLWRSRLFLPCRCAIRIAGAKMLTGGIRW
jgi:hypothetical protein